MGKNPSYFSKNPIDGENQKRRPVEFISWYDAINFCNQLTILIMGEDECCYTLSNIMEDKASALSVLILQNKRPFYLIKKAFPATQGKPKLEYKLLSSHYTRMV